MGEKDLFHDPSVKVPLIIYDPRSDADATRGTVCDALVESIDLPATFIEMAGGTIPHHILEGRSLMPHLNGEKISDWREFAVSEYDYSVMPACSELGLDPKDARLFMITDKQWKFMHAEGGFTPMLFDLVNDPDELVDLGRAPESAEVIGLMYKRLRQWGTRMSQRVTTTDDWVKSERDAEGTGVLIGIVSPDEVSPETAGFYNPWIQLASATLPTVYDVRQRCPSVTHRLK